MLRKPILFALSFVVLLCIASNGFGYIVDTGPGPSVASGTAFGTNGGRAAVEVTLDQDVTINSIEAWIYINFEFDHYLTISIYRDGGDIPDDSNKIYTTGNSQIYESTTDEVGAGWYGLFGLNWSLNPGTYWVAFEYPNINTWLPNPSTNPIGNEAFSTGTWGPADSLDMGVRIDAVPIPGAFWLLGSGLIGIVGIRRKLRK